MKLKKAISLKSTDTGVSQGDTLRINEFILYLSRALYKENNDHICKESTITTSFDLSSIKHDHRKGIDEHSDITRTW